MMTTDRFDELVTQFQNETSDEAKVQILDDIAALFMPIVEARVFGRTYPSFNIPMYLAPSKGTVEETVGNDEDEEPIADGAEAAEASYTVPVSKETYQDTMRHIAYMTLCDGVPKYEVGGVDCFESYMLPRVRAAFREYLHSLDTLDYIYILQHGVTDKEREMLLNLLVEKNDRLVLYTINKHYSSYRFHHLADMQQCGRMALIEHAEGYDFTKINAKTNAKTNAPFKFSTYITPYILDALKAYICKFHDITPHYAVQIKRFEKAEAELRRRGNDEPTLDQVANEMGVGIDAARKVYNIQRRMNTVSIEDNERDKRLPNPLRDTPEAIVEKQELVLQLRRAILTLTSEQQKVINATYFNASGKEASLAEVSKKLGWDVTRTRRVKNQALRRLEDSPELSDFTQSSGRQKIEQFASSLVLEFTLPQEAIAFNLDIAMSDDEGVMFG